tara:strand:+ start:410 stop:748 length:339 start_codon:yes stop_codon:yes gene_type:complete
MAKKYFSKFSNDFKNLCSPAFVYLLLSVLAFVVVAIQNFGNTNSFCLGPYNCLVPNTFFIFLFEALYILFWTFILNSLCKAGYKEISWLLVLLPLILFFVILALILVSFPSV